MLVYVEGRIQTRQWEDKRDGQKRSTTEIVGNVMRMLGSRAEGAAAGASAGGGQRVHSRSTDADFDVAGPPARNRPQVPKFPTKISRSERMARHERKHFVPASAHKRCHTIRSEVYSYLVEEFPFGPLGAAPSAITSRLSSSSMEGRVGKTSEAIERR